MKKKNIVDVLFAFFMIYVVIRLFISLAPILLILGGVALVGYLGYRGYLYFGGKIKKAIHDSKFDDKGRKIVKTSVLEITDANEE